MLRWIQRKLRNEVNLANKTKFCSDLYARLVLFFLSFDSVIIWSLIFSFFKHMIKRIPSTRSTMSKLDKLYFQLQEYN